MNTQELEHLKDTVRKLCGELENLWIEKEAYKELILLSCVASPEALQTIADTALADPKIRKQTREQFAEMWEALEKFGMSAWFEEQLNKLPPSGKPN